MKSTTHRLCLALISSFWIVSCTSADMALLSGNPAGALDLAKGSGALLRAPNGDTTFRYAFAASGLDGLVPKEQQEQARRDYIAQYLASQNACSKGWSITTREVIQSSILYEGKCA